VHATRALQLQERTYGIVVIQYIPLEADALSRSNLCKLRLRKISKN